MRKAGTTGEHKLQLCLSLNRKLRGKEHPSTNSASLEKLGSVLERLKKLILLNPQSKKQDKIIFGCENRNSHEFGPWEN